VKNWKVTRSRSSRPENSYQTGLIWPQLKWLYVAANSHPAHTLYSTVEKQTILACGGCGDVFGASKEVEASGVKISRELPIPGTTGILSLANYIVDGYQIVNF